MGRVILNDHLPKGTPFVNGLLRKKGLQAPGAVRLPALRPRARPSRCSTPSRTSASRYATRAGISIGIDDLIIPEGKEKLVGAAQKDVIDVEKQYLDGAITNGERYNKVISIWSSVTEKVADAMFHEMEAQDRKGEEFNPIYIMADSGARGSKQQIRQLAGMRGLMARPSGRSSRTPSPQLPRGPHGPAVLHLDPRRPQGPGRHGLEDGRLGLPHPPPRGRLPGRPLHATVTSLCDDQTSSTPMQTSRTRSSTPRGPRHLQRRTCRRARRTSTACSRSRACSSWCSTCYLRLGLETHRRHARRAQGPRLPLRDPVGHLHRHRRPGHPGREGEARRRRAQNDVIEVEQQYLDGAITNGERYNKVIAIWSERHREGRRRDVPARWRRRTGRARSSTRSTSWPTPAPAARKQQIRQLAGMRGLMAQPLGRDHREPHHVELPRGPRRCCSTSSRPTAPARASRTPRSRRRTPAT